MPVARKVWQPISAELPAVLARDSGHGINTQSFPAECHPVTQKCGVKGLLRIGIKLLVGSLRDLNDRLEKDQMPLSRSDRIRSEASITLSFG